MHAARMLFVSQQIRTRAISSSAEHCGGCNATRHRTAGAQGGAGSRASHEHHIARCWTCSTIAEAPGCIQVGGSGRARPCLPPPPPHARSTRQPHCCLPPSLVLHILLQVVIVRSSCHHDALFGARTAHHVRKRGSAVPLPLCRRRPAFAAAASARGTPRLLPSTSLGHSLRPPFPWPAGSGRLWRQPWWCLCCCS